MDINLALHRTGDHLQAMRMMTILPTRGVVEISGEDRVPFLQGLVSNDVEQAGPDRAVWAALLTPQGKWLADFFVIAAGDRLLLECEAAQAAMLVKILGRYRLRSKVVLRNASAEFAVHAAWGDRPDLDADSDGIVVADPRLPEAGWRVLAALPLPASGTMADWDAHRISLGLPDGSRDLESEKTILLEAGFDELGGVSWSKGCYMGQELTARTKYRGLVKRRLVPVTVTGPMPEPGAPIFRGTKEMGVLRSSAGSLALAVLRLEALAGGDALNCGNAVLEPRLPAWMKLPMPSSV